MEVWHGSNSETIQTTTMTPPSRGKRSRQPTITAGFNQVCHKPYKCHLENEPPFCSSSIQPLFIPLSILCSSLCPPLCPSSVHPSVRPLFTLCSPLCSPSVHPSVHPLSTPLFISLSSLRWSNSFWKTCTALPSASRMSRGL